jgi:hypothetical protein
MTKADRMTIKEVSEYVHIGVHTLQRKPWRKKNKFPLGKIGRYLVSYKPLLDKWIENRLNGKN